MAFYIRSNDNNQFTWYVNQEKPESITGAWLLKADGDELREIQRRFSGIPNLTHDGICIWRAPWAQFIYENL